MLLFAIAAAALVTGFAPPEPNASLFTDARPPARFQTDATVVLQTADQDGINRACHPLYGTPPAGMKTDACEIGNRVIAPNPCSFPESDRYAQILCHEMAHANGWPPTHGD